MTKPWCVSSYYTHNALTGLFVYVCMCSQQSCKQLTSCLPFKQQIDVSMTTHVIQDEQMWFPGNQALLRHNCFCYDPDKAKVSRLLLIWLNYGNV